MKIHNLVVVGLLGVLLVGGVWMIPSQRETGLVLKPASETPVLVTPKVSTLVVTIAAPVNPSFSDPFYEIPGYYSTGLPSDGDVMDSWRDVPEWVTTESGWWVELAKPGTQKVKLLCFNYGPERVACGIGDAEGEGLVVTFYDGVYPATFEVRNHYPVKRISILSQGEFYVEVEK